MSTNDNTTKQVSLNNFDHDPIEQATLPDRDYGWSDESFTAYDLTLAQPEPASGSYVSLGGDRHIATDECAYIIDGVEDYLAEHGQHEVDFPAYYSRFEDEFDAELTFHSAFRSNSVGVGITHYKLEDAIRFATGGGRFSKSDVTVTACGRHPFVVQSPDGAFLVDTASVSKPPEGYEPTHTTVAGMEIQEEHQLVQDGIESMVDALDAHYGVTVSSWEKMRSGQHTFRLESGEEFTVTGYNLIRLGKTVTDSDEVLKEYEIQTSFDETFYPEWEVLRWETGEVMDNRYGRRELEETPADSDRTFCDGDADLGDEICLGYRMTWEDPRKSSRVSMTGKIKAHEGYVYGVLSEKNGHITFDVSTHTDPMAEFEPENEEWSPI